MNLLLTIKNSEHKNQLQKLIESKVDKLNKYLTSNIRVSWNYFSEHGLHLSEVKVSGFSGPEIKATAKSDNMYKVVDMALNRVTTQLRKRSDKKHTNRVRSMARSKNALLNLE